MKKTQQEWLELLWHSHLHEDSMEADQTSRLEYLAKAVFGIWTYDGEKDEEFAGRAVEVALTISNKTTFDYIKEPGQYRWYLLLCHFPFFADRIEWGCSIRGAWWRSYEGIKFQSCSLWEISPKSQTQLHEEMTFDEKGWQAFIDAVCEYAQGERP